MLIVTCSIGISIYPDDAQERDTLVKYADRAMYNAKNIGKNNFKFYV
ncbi:MAG: diguanylate cyclase [Epsilonproteobacteria bacterium]|nr:diguanylate cyclase [Campylobacterota bacterium]